MAKKKAPAIGNTFKRLEVAGKLLPRIGIVAGKGMIEKIWPEHRVVKRGSDVLRMNCPIHDDPTPSCDLNFITGRIFCFGCKFRTGNLFEFLQRGKGWSYKVALDTIRQYVDLRAISEATAKEINAVDVWQSATGFLMEACNEHLQRLLTPAGNAQYTKGLMETSQPTLDWLFKVRRRDPDLVSIMPYGVIPPELVTKNLLREILDKEVDRRAANKLSYPSKEWREEVFEQANTIYRSINSSFVHAVSFHTGYNFTTPGRIKIRRPSNDKAGNIEVVPGRNEEDPLGYFGLYRPHLVGRAALEVNDYKFPVVEGEFDALSLMEGIEREGKAGVVVLASGGDANETDALSENAQITQVHVIGDEPRQGGDSFVRGRLSTSYEIDPRVFNRWDKILAAYPGVKDPDDVVRTAGFDYAYTMFIDTPDHYILASEWAFARVQEELATKEIEEGNLRPALDLVAQYGPCVRHPATQARFIELVAGLTKLSPGELRQSIVQSRGTEAAFKAQLIECLRREFTPLYCTQSLRSPVLRMFHKERRVTVEFPINDGEAIGLAIARIHGSVYDFIRDQVGLPMFLDKDTGAPNTTPEKEVMMDLYTYLKLALQEMIKGVPLRNDCEEHGQGLHYLPDPGSPGDYAHYNVIGPRVYKGRHTAQGGAKLIWTELDGPADGVHLFRTTRQSWSEEVRSAEDLNEGNHLTKTQLLALLHRAEDMFRIGWRFAHQETDPKYLAYILAAYAVSYVWPMKTILAINGDTHSGKSTLLSVMCSGTHPALRMLEMSASIDLFSQAGVYQRYSRSSLLLCFDELEEDGDSNQKHSFEVTGLIRMMRSVIGEHGSSIVRGAKNGEDAPDYLINTPIAFASILRARKPEDDNRRMDIETKKVGDHRDPSQLIFQKYTLDDVRGIRRALSTGMAKFALEFQEHYKAIRAKINTTQVVPFKVPTRYLNNYLPVCAIMAMLGQPWEPFLIQSCEVRQTRLATLAGETNASVLYERLFRAANVHPISGDSRVTCRVTDMFRTDGMVGDLNRTRCGVFVIPDRQLAVIDWITAQNKGGVLEGWAEYRMMTHRNLKHALDQHPQSLRTEDYSQYGVDRFVRSMGSSYNPSTISVINVKDLITEIRSEPDASGAPTADVDAPVRSERASHAGPVVSDPSNDNNI